ncbi:MAG: hypothetical protein FWE77_01270 [Clostridia bacterium]|nr:hypothetical protein [Clostridia bacterium]
MRLLVSDAGNGTLTAYDARTLAPLVSRDMPGAGALCAWRGAVLCADSAEGCVRALDAGTLETLRSVPAGPGIRALRPGVDGASLYALAGDADSLLKLDIAGNTLEMLARVGVQPRDLAMDPSGRLLAVAGGASCCVHLLRSDTLAPTATVDVGGIAVGVCFGPGALWALCAVGQEEMSSCLMRVRAGNWRIERTLHMEGMPGGLIGLPDEGVLIGLLDGVVYVAKHGKRAAWRIPLEGALPDMAARSGARVYWSDALGSRIWTVHSASAYARPCELDVEEPSGILLL